MTSVTDLAGWPEASRQAFEGAYLAAAQNAGCEVIVKSEGDHLVVSLAKSKKETDMTTTDYLAAEKGLSAADSDRVRAAARALVGSGDTRVQGLYSKCLGLLSGSQDGMGDESDALMAKAAELRKSDTTLSQYEALVMAGKDPSVTTGARARTEAVVKAQGHVPGPWDHLAYDPDNSTPSPGDLARMIGR
jgi:hypothetical protein